MQYNIADLFEAVADTVPENAALVCGETRWTYAELDGRANRMAHWLLAQGIGAGDHVGLHLYNSAEFIETALALVKIRAVPININYRYVAAELRYLFEDADLKAVFHQQGFSSVVAEAAAGNDQLKVFVYVPDDSDDDVSQTGSSPYETAMSSASPDRGFAERSADDLYIIYTGGTTGMPRGVMWRHEDLFFAGLQGGRAGGDHIERPEELAEVIAEGNHINIHPAAPLIHGAAQLASWICFFSGGKVCLVPGRSFVPESSAALISAEEVNVVNLVGDAMARPFAETLEAGGDAYDCSTMYALSSAGAVLSDVVKEKLQQVLPDAMILNNYGASETGHQGTAMSGKGGRAQFFMHGDDTAVLDENHQVIEPGSGRSGKLARKGNIPMGYYKAPEKTRATFAVVDGVRWVLPGDMAIPEADGSITLLGRGSVCINTGGEKVFPEEVEESLKAHPEVLDAVVVGVPDERWGERVEALVLARPGTSPTSESVDAHCRTLVAGYKAPRAYHFVDTMNRHPSGKPDYRWARDKAVEMGS